MITIQSSGIRRTLLAAERFYRRQLPDSWVPAYLAARGVQPRTISRWRIGYAATDWSALTAHLLRQGYDSGMLQAAGLTHRSSRGVLIDHFRDRVMIPIRDEHGALVGFIGRARPESASAVPKYLNSPETVAYRKGHVLFGLYEARGQLAHGAVPVIVEGPFDAIAVSSASPHRLAGLAPCGTALTTQQVAALAATADLRRTGALVALDGDAAGQQGTVKAYRILASTTAKLSAVVLPSGVDPAQILDESGAAALAHALQRVRPLAEVVVDAHLDQWVPRLDHAEGRLHAMRSAARLIADLLPQESLGQIQLITGGRQLVKSDDVLHTLVHPELPIIARLLPADAIRQIIRSGERTGYECVDIVAEVANLAVAAERHASISGSS